MADDNLAQPFIQGALAGQQFQLNKFLIEEAPVKLEKEKLALKIADSDFSRRQQMADMLAGKSSQIPPGQDPLTNAANTMFQIGQSAAEAGLPEESISAISKGSTILNQQENAAYKRFQSTMQQTKYADQLLATIPDGISQEEGQRLWDQMNAHVQMTTGKPSSLQDKKYSPELVHELREASMKKLSSAQEDWYKARTEREKGLEKADAARAEQSKAAAGLSETRARIAGKNGGAGLIPKPANVSAVADLIIKNSGDSMDAHDARTLARDVALDAEALMDREKLDQPTAVAKAVQNAKRDGRIPSDSSSRARKGTSPKSTLPLPKDPKELKNGLWYTTPSGPQWYDEETRKVYPLGEGPEDEEEEAK
jgi:hypothetical protein